MNIEIIEPPGGEFKEGDIVKNIMTNQVGTMHTIVGGTYPMIVKYDSSNIQYLPNNQGIALGTVIPFLSFISRPKVKKTVTIWNNIYYKDNKYITESLDFDTKEQAICQNMGENYITTVPLTFEVEE